MLEPGRFGDFELIRPLGKPGAFGAVYEAIRGDRRLALKIFHAELLDGVPAERFEREVKTMLKASHPNVVPYEDYGVHSQGGRTWHWIAMRYLEGQSLRQLLEAAEGGRFGPARACEIGRQIAAGIAALHAANIVHRDLKPENVFVCDDGTVVLLDFGVALFLDYTALTENGAFVGTMRYAAPEQLAGDAVPASDLHALGVLLFEMVTGKRPFRANGFGLYQQIIQEPAEPISAWVADAPAELCELIACLLEKEPMDRPPAAAGVGRALTPRLELSRVTVARKRYGRDEAPKLFVRVRHDAEAVVGAGLAGHVPDGVIVQINEPTPLAAARRAAGAFPGIDFACDPRLMAMRYLRWSNTLSLKALPYAPADTAPHGPEDFRSLERAQELARAVVTEQVDRGARVAVAAAMPLEAAEDPWLVRNPAFLEASLAAAEAYGIPLWAVLAVSIDAISRPEQQVDLFNRVARGEPTAWWLHVDALSGRSEPPQLVAAIRFALLMQERGAPVIPARATGLWRLLAAAGIGALEVGLGRYDGFRFADLREGGGPGHTPPRYEVPELCAAVPRDIAGQLLERELVGDCDCPACERAGSSLSARLDATPEHNLHVIVGEIAAMAGIAPEQRAAELQERLMVARSLETRLRREGVLRARALPHLVHWPKTLDALREAGLLSASRIERRRRGA